MATYAIGDLQGCYRPLRQLLERLDFDPAHDQLWLVGDLVNRGPDSLACLRFVRDLGDAAITVLGNHDLTLLARASRPNPQVNETLTPILEAEDRDELLHWLRHRPLLHRDTTLGWTSLHAGLAPEWSPAQAESLAGEVEQVLRSDDYPAFFEHMYGNQPDRWSHDLTGWDRLRMITNCLTRMRMCHPDGALDLSHKTTLADAPGGLLPWFALPERASADERIVFGHWSALERVAWPEHNVWGIDTGCVWGGKMTALRLDGEAPEVIGVDCG